jgi:hypothetical protein
VKVAAPAFKRLACAHSIPLRCRGCLDLNTTSPSAAMSFITLPFELIELIAEHLDQQGLNALIRVSSTTRRAAERYLYRDIEIYASRSESSGWLITTLLQRRKLAEHIRSVTYVANRWPDNPMVASPVLPAVSLSQPLGVA